VALAKPLQEERVQIVFENAQLVVQASESGEVFVHHRDSPASQVRICPDYQGVILTAKDGRLTPCAKDGHDAILVQGK
jgi:hypothetical protein